jgi:hypothetical protein
MLPTATNTEMSSSTPTETAPVATETAAETPTLFLTETPTASQEVIAPAAPTRTPPPLFRRGRPSARPRPFSTRPDRIEPYRR